MFQLQACHIALLSLCSLYEHCFEGRGDQRCSDRTNHLSITFEMYLALLFKFLILLFIFFFVSFLWSVLWYMDWGFFLFVCLSLWNKGCSVEKMNFLTCTKMYSNSTDLTSTGRSFHHCWVKQSLDWDEWRLCPLSDLIAKYPGAKQRGGHAAVDG